MMIAALIFLAVWAALIVFAFSLGRTAADADRRIRHLDFPRPVTPPRATIARTGGPGRPLPTPGSPVAPHERTER